MLYLISLGIFFWFLCGILAAGITFANFQAKFPDLAVQDRREDLGFAYLFLIFGPITLMVAFFMSGFCEHGIKFK